MIDTMQGKKIQTPNTVLSPIKTDIRDGIDISKVKVTYAKSPEIVSK